MACRAPRAERSIVPNEESGMSRDGAALRSGETADGPDVSATGRGGGAAATGGGAGAASKTTGVRGGGDRSSGVVTRGGRGCAQVRLTFGAGVRGAGVITRRGRTGGGGCVPGGAPRASRKRRTRSASLSAGGRGGGDCRGCSLGEDGGGFAPSAA